MNRRLFFRFFKICKDEKNTTQSRLIEYCGNCLDVRLFIRYDPDETLPWHSTISRTRQLYGEEVFLALFRKVVSMCVHKGMVRGKRQAIYNKEPDRYECTRGNKAILPFRLIFTDKKGYQKRVYRSDNSKCKNCPLRSSCIGKSDFKKLDDSIDKPYCDRMHQRMQTQYAGKVSKIRSGLATKHVLMAVLCYNLKKYMKFKSPKVISAIKSMDMNKIGDFFNTPEAVSGLINGFLINMRLIGSVLLLYNLTGKDCHLTS